MGKSPRPKNRRSAPKPERRPGTSREPGRGAADRTRTRVSGERTRQGFIVLGSQGRRAVFIGGLLVAAFIAFIIAVIFI